jgi:hypothetical protein
VAQYTVTWPQAKMLVREPSGAADGNEDVVHGLGQPAVQSFEMLVFSAAQSEMHAVVLATRPPLSEHDRAVITRAYAATLRPRLSFLVDEDAQGLRVVSDAGVDPGAGAAAVAVAWAGSRETPPATAVLIGDSKLTVQLSRGASGWTCQVEAG